MSGNHQRIGSEPREGTARPNEASSFPPPELPAASRIHLGSQLRASYASVMAEEVPARLLDLVARFEAALAHSDASASATFRSELLAAIPDLRAFARSLAVDASRADDLVQETLLKAWRSQQRFAPGSNFKAWTFTILRNQFYSECRKARREVEDPDGAAAARLTTLPDQVDRVELEEVWARLGTLPPLQREALLLVGSQGLTYEAAAEVLGCQVGTVKSRVSRGRALLSHLLGFADGRLSRASA